MGALAIKMGVIDLASCMKALLIAAFVILQLIAVRIKFLV